MKRHVTVGDVLQAWSDTLLAFGAAWALQLFVLIGFGIGVGVASVLTGVWMAAR